MSAMRFATSVVALLGAALGLAGCRSTGVPSNAATSPAHAQVSTCPAHWIGRREVTWREYAAYLVVMRDPEKARRYRHPNEPDSKLEPDARAPSTSAGADDLPVRGIDWWDAYACARFLGGQIPTEADWEKAARPQIEWFVIPSGDAPGDGGR